MEPREEQVTTEMAALDRQLFVELSATKGSDVPTVRLLPVSDARAPRPRAPARGEARTRVTRAVEWGAWGLLMVAPVFTLSC